MSKQFFDKTIGALNTSMNLRMLNQNVISSNIANSETPGYKQKKVEFERAFREALGTDDRLKMVDSDGFEIDKSTDPVKPEIFEDPNGIESLDGNTVNRADQMAKLQENQFLYNASVELLKKKLSMLKYAVSNDGGR
ncbi:MAG: flagellar basal body rod protein FlgB [Bdellovibrionaceae bacterium]|nr:flagellar basal body rod protein FlgB [Pseudobdellovibrionaceae bacterium]